MSPRIPTSTAYWNLRAEQVMDRVFTEATPSLKAVEIRVDPQVSTDSNAKRFKPWQQFTLTGVTLGALLSSAWLARSWYLSAQTLQRERNLALTKKLEERATPSPKTNQVETERGNELPPLDLPSLEPLTLPLSTPLAPSSASATPNPSPSTTTESLSSDPSSQPVLVGVVHAETGGSAIFQLEDQSLSAAPGESIGSSGWSVLSMSSTGAVIERNGEKRTLSISGAF